MHGEVWSVRVGQVTESMWDHRQHLCDDTSV